MSNAMQCNDSLVQGIRRLLSEGEVAQLLGCSVFKLQQDRFKKTGLPWVKIGRLCRYRPEDVESFIQANYVGAGI